MCKTLSRSVEFRTIGFFLFVVLGVFAFSQSAQAIVSRVDVQDVLQQDSVQETVRIALENNNQSSMLFGLPPEAKDVTINGKSVPSNTSINASLACKSCSIVITYSLTGVIHDEGEGAYSFSRTLNMPSPRTLNYDIHLPPGSFLSTNNSADPSIVPQPSEIRTDGTSVIIAWAEKNPELPQRYFVRYATAASIAPDSELVEWLLFVPLFLLGVGLGAWLQKKYGKRVAAMVGDVVPASLLSPDERAIIAMMEKSDGAIGQKELGKQIGWSKSKVSALMTNLQHKGIIAREKVGRNYRVTLVKRVE